MPRADGRSEDLKKKVAKSRVARRGQGGYGLPGFFKYRKEIRSRNLQPYSILFSKGFWTFCCPCLIKKLNEPPDFLPNIGVGNA